MEPLQEQIATSCAPTQCSQSRNTSSTNTVTGLFSVIVAICFPLFAFIAIYEIGKKKKHYKSGVNVIVLICLSFFYFTRRMTLSRYTWSLHFSIARIFWGDFLPISLYTLSVMLTLCCLFAYTIGTCIIFVKDR